jgi:hypothetical protein
MGYVLFAFGKGEPKQISDYRLSLSEQIFANYKFVEVDISNRIFNEEIKLPSRLPGITFDAKVTVSYRVTEPVLALKNATRMVIGDEIRLSLIPKLEKASRSAAGSSGTNAESKAIMAIGSNQPVGDGTSVTDAPTLTISDINSANLNAEAACAAFKDAKPFAEYGIDLRTVTASLSLAGEAEKLAESIGLLGLKLNAKRAEQELTDQERAHQERILAGGLRKMVAEVMRTKPDMITGLLDQLSAVEQVRYQNDIAIFNKLLDEKAVEPHQIPTNVRDEFLQNLLNRATLGDIMLLGTKTKEGPLATENKLGSE